MTALNIRKNTAAFLKLAATAVENTKVPTKAQASVKLNEYRIRAAALMMPSECYIVINSKQDI